MSAAPRASGDHRRRQPCWLPARTRRRRPAFRTVPAWSLILPNTFAVYSTTHRVPVVVVRHPSLWELGPLYRYRYRRTNSSFAMPHASTPASIIIMQELAVQLQPRLKPPSGPTPTVPTIMAAIALARGDASSARAACKMVEDVPKSARDRVQQLAERARPLLPASDLLPQPPSSEPTLTPPQVLPNLVPGIDQVFDAWADDGRKCGHR